jgi:hypothetical protein
VFLIADAGKHQQLRRIYHSGAQHHLAAHANDFVRAVIVEFHPRGLVVQ